MHFDLGSLGAKEIFIDTGNGTYTYELKEEMDTEDLSLRELQELVRSLVERVEKLEQHHARF